MKTGGIVSTPRANLIVALGYILGGYIGSLVSFPPANISPFWPPSGIALAALLLCGKRILPGLFLGICFMQAYSFADTSFSSGSLHSFLIAFVISIGSASQALVGFYLIERFVGRNDPLMENRKIALFLFLGGPLSCLIAPAVGSFIFLVTGKITSSEFLFTYANWWAGNTIGVLIFTPVILILFARPRELWQWRIKSVIYPMLVLLAVIMIAINYFYRQDWQRVSVEFDRQTSIVQATIYDKIRDHIELSDALKAFFDASTEVTGEDFRIFADSLLGRPTGANTLAWIPRVTAGQREQFENNWRGPGSITESGPDDTIVPAGPRDEYFPLRFIVPLEGNERAQGYDVSVIPSIKAAMTFARDTGEIGAISPTHLISDIEMNVSTVFYSPLYSGKPNWDTVEERRQHLVGFVANVFRVTDTLGKIVKEYHALQLNLVIHDGDKLVYSSINGQNDNGMAEHELKKMLKVNVANRIWDFLYTPTDDFFEYHLFRDLWLLLFGSFVFAALAGTGLLLLTGHTLRTESLVKERTSELENEIKERKHSEETVQQLAYYDMLTDLPNRRLLLDRLERDIAAVSRHNTYGAVLYIDLDNFKTLNDSMGHQVGDQLLVQVAQRLKVCIREEDTAARLGGDEFVILLREEHPDPETLSDRILILAQRIQYELGKPFDLNGYLHHMSPSIGITFFSKEVNSPDEVLKQADTAMYSAKAKGRNTISYYHPEMQKHVDERLQLEKDLRTALEKHQFRLFYQPQYDESLNIVSAEALIRWEHPAMGLVSPVDFIPVAEENKLVIPIGEWVLSEVCARLVDWPELDYIAINISPVQLLSEGFVQHMEQVLKEQAKVRNRIMLEMTEGIMIGDMMSTSKIIRDIQKLGVGISIDDFGRGYSSLAYLKHFPLNQLKIDKDFISDIELDPSGNVIVETIIAMARHLKLSVIAEGVETRQQLTFLQEQDCTGFQGFYFSKPLPAGDFEKLLRENKKSNII